MASAGEADVTEMAREISKVTSRDGWKSDKSVVPDMQRLLGQLTTLKVDKNLLQRTKIGAAVNKLKKHDDEVVRGYSTSLTKKWKTEVGINNAKAVEPSSMRPPQRLQRVPSPSPPNRDSIDQKRLENAKKRLQQGYASEKAKRESRTVQVLSGPVAKGRRGTTISAAPSRSSIGRAQLLQRRHLSGMSTAAHRGSSAPPATLRVLPASRTQTQMRRPTPSLANMSAEERHRHRQLKYQALSGQISREGDRREPERVRSSSQPQTSGRPRPSPHLDSRLDSRPNSRPSSASSSKNPPHPTDSRKAMLNKMYPRVCGVSSASTGSSKSGGSAPKGRGTSAAARRKQTNYTESQREVLEWLRSLSVDMSEYAPAFFENGFDSVKLLSTIEKSDLPSLVPKMGHHRLIQQALNDLRHKHSTSASSQRRERIRKDPSRMRRDDPFDEESDDSFVVSDDDEYHPGHIAAMFRKNRKRRYSIESDDSLNMEATFDEIQKEEKRSAIYGEYEDYKEDMRNKKMLKKKK